MDNAVYATLTRQSGLMREMQAIAHNIANASTAGFRKEGVIFSEHVVRTGVGEASLSMAAARARHTSGAQGALSRTGARFDFAIEGEGFFRLETSEGIRLTRNGSFTPNEAGEVVAPDGARLLDAAGAPVFVPPDARSVTLAPDGTLSADDRPLAQIGLVRPVDRVDMTREAGTRFHVEGPTEPVASPRIAQGFLEESNVEPVSEMARMIEVQRAYELGQKFLQREDERIRSVLQTLGR